MKIESFEEIEAWKEARVLVKEIYHYFKDLKDYGFRGQIQDAAVSIMSNIAEGFDRRSNKEFINFLGIARGSASEVRSLNYVALDACFIDEMVFNNFKERCIKVSNLINGFIRYLQNSERKA